MRYNPNQKKRILITGGSGFIGTNYIEFLLKDKNYDFINLDVDLPRNLTQKDFWRKCDLLDLDNLKKIIKDFSPNYVVHLAAKTGVDEKKLSDFKANTEGVENLLDIFKEIPCLERVIFTSSLLVCEMGYVPKHDTDYNPSTPYGLSKVKMEEIVRKQKNLPYTWTIIRPISIWGPWFDEPYKNFFKAVVQGWYFHIGSGHYKRSLGYVENIIYQIHRLLLAPLKKVDKKTFYLADNKPADLYDFANEIEKVSGAKKIRHIPLWFAKSCAKIGDVLKYLGWKSVPLTSFRLNNILTEYVFDMHPIMEISGFLPYNFKTGVRRTIQWMHQVGEI
ncbi:NAD(P)-dependent oxidoreductase [Candidatus Parcubacteria bacterium]|nr:NAD(P)-dependent oxidoreductase [Candidatus Parcubacteria bacterium]